MQNGSAMASVTGRNTTTLTQANLPNTTFTGSTNNTGSHSHSVSTSTNGSHSHSGSALSAGAHTHPIEFRNSTAATESASGNQPWSQGSFTTNSNTMRTTIAGNHTHNLSIDSNGNHSHSLNINSSGHHSHTITVNSGGTNEPFNIAPKNLTVNMFIYLGL